MYQEEADSHLECTCRLPFAEHVRRLKDLVSSLTQRPNQQAFFAFCFLSIKVEGPVVVQVLMMRVSSLTPSQGCDSPHVLFKASIHLLPYLAKEMF
jgi:hypothetical protein